MPETPTAEAETEDAGVVATTEAEPPPGRPTPPDEVTTARGEGGHSGPELEPPDDHEKLAEIIELNREVVTLQADFDRKQKAAKAAKLALEEAADALSRHIRSLDEELPLFDQAARQSAAEVAVSDPAPAPEAWRATSVLILGALHGLSAAVVDRLVQAGIDTIGKVADWTARGKLLTDIPGIGEAKADAIDEALGWFWAARQPADDAPDEPDRRPLSGEANDLLDAAFGDDEDRDSLGRTAHEIAADDAAGFPGRMARLQARQEGRDEDEPDPGTVIETDPGKFTCQPDAGTHTASAEAPKRARKGKAAGKGVRP